jgi:hypothetical protein
VIGYGGVQRGEVEAARAALVPAAAAADWRAEPGGAHSPPARWDPQQKQVPVVGSWQAGIEVTFDWRGVRCTVWKAAGTGGSKRCCAVDGVLTHRITQHGVFSANYHMRRRSCCQVSEGASLYTRKLLSLSVVL